MSWDCFSWFSFWIGVAAGAFGPTVLGLAVLFWFIHDISRPESQEDQSE